MTFGENLAMARQRMRLSVYALGQRSGIPPTTISRIERGETDPQLQTAARLAAAVGVSLSDLYGELPSLPELPEPRKRGRKPRTKEVEA